MNKTTTIIAALAMVSTNVLAYDYGSPIYNNKNYNNNNNFNKNNNTNNNNSNSNANASASGGAGGNAVVNNDNGYYYPPAFSVGGSNNTTIGTVSKGFSVSTPFGGAGFQSSDDHPFTQAMAAYALHDPAVHSIALEVIKQELKKHIKEEKKEVKNDKGAFGY
jgi:hypothetical protein